MLTNTLTHLFILLFYALQVYWYLNGIRTHTLCGDNCSSLQWLILPHLWTKIIFSGHKLCWQGFEHNLCSAQRWCYLCVPTSHLSCCQNFWANNQYCLVEINYSLLVQGRGLVFFFFLILQSYNIKTNIIWNIKSMKQIFFKN